MFESSELERRRIEIVAKYISASLVIFCWKEFEIFALCKSNSQAEATFTVYSEPMFHVILSQCFMLFWANVSEPMATRSKCKQREQSKKPAKLTDIS